MDDKRWIFWRDYTDRAPGWGHVITMPNSHGFVLTAFLSTIVTIAGGSAWKMISLLIHAHFARQGPTTDVYGLQQQVALRNPGSAFRAALDAIMIHSSWSKVPGMRRLRRTAMIAVPGVLIWSAFTVASIMVSFIATQSDDRVMVQVKPDRCGLMLPYRETDGGFDSLPGADLNDMVMDKYANDAIQARTYALSVQPNSTSSGKQGSIYVNPKLKYTFKEQDCMLPNQEYCLTTEDDAATTVSLTSDRLCSHGDLGINAPPSDRVYLQQRAMCSLVDRRPFVMDPTSTDWYDYDLGPVGDNTAPTFSYPIGVWNTTIGYQVEAAYAPDNQEDEDGVWHPVKELSMKDADMGIIIMTQNGVLYAQEVEDPWFSASVARGSSFEGDAWIKIMVCADQYRWCTSSDEEDDKCTPWGGAVALRRSAVKQGGVLNYNPAQRATALRLSWDPLRDAPSILDSAVNMGAASLFANNKVRYNRQSTRLPKTQWQTEVKGWFEAALASRQAAADEFVRKGPNLAALRVYPPLKMTEELTGLEDVTPEMLQVLQSQCGNQLSVDAGNLQNFSLNGVIIVIVVSAALVLLSSWFSEILDVISDLHVRLHHRRHRVGQELSTVSQTKIARQADDRLHLLRYALDGASNSHDGKGKAWREVSFTGVPVLTPPGINEELTQRDLTVRRPVMMAADDGLFEYPRQQHDEELRTLVSSPRSTVLHKSQIPIYQPEAPAIESVGDGVSMYQTDSGSQHRPHSGRHFSSDFGAATDSESSKLLQSPGFPHYEPSPPLRRNDEDWMSPEGDLGRSPNIEPTTFPFPK